MEGSPHVVHLLCTFPFLPLHNLPGHDPSSTSWLLVSFQETCGALAVLGVFLCFFSDINVAADLTWFHSSDFGQAPPVFFEVDLRTTETLACLWIGRRLVIQGVMAVERGCVPLNVVA